MAANLDALTAQVADTVGAEESAAVLIAGLASALQAAKNDPVAIQAIVDQMRASSDKLKAAVAANPVEPPPPPPTPQGRR